MTDLLRGPSSGWQERGVLRSKDACSREDLHPTGISTPRPRLRRSVSSPFSPVVEPASSTELLGRPVNRRRDLNRTGQRDVAIVTN